MTAVIFRLRAELRTRWRSWLAVAVVAGLGAAVVLTLFAGARRTEAAYPEFANAQDASDVLLAGRSDFGLIGAVDLDDVERLPEVRATSRAYAALLFTGRTSDGRRVGPGDVFPVAPEDDRLGTEVERWKILEGRRADPERVDEATASFVLADRLHLDVGDTIRLHFVKGESFIPVAGRLLSEFGPRLRGAPGSEASTIDQLADGPDITFRIVGIEASPAEFPPLAPDLSPALHLTPAFTRRTGTVWWGARSCTPSSTSAISSTRSPRESNDLRRDSRWGSSSRVARADGEGAPVDRGAGRGAASGGRPHAHCADPRRRGRHSSAKPSSSRPRTSSTERSV